MNKLFQIFFVMILFVTNTNASDDKIFQDITTLNNKMTECLKHYRPGLDVHKFNGRLKPLSQLLTKLNSDLKLNKLYSSESLIDELFKFRKELKFGAEHDIEITALSNHFKSGLDFDKETATSVKATLSAILNHLNAVDLKQQTAVASQLFFYLKQNTLEGGKCFPGYAGRLMIVNISCLMDQYLLLQSLK